MPRAYSQPIYEVSVYTLGTENLIRSKMAVMNFDPDSDRYSQIEDAVRQRFAGLGTYTVHLMKPKELEELDKLNDYMLFGSHKLPSGVITQFIELGNRYWEY